MASFVNSLPKSRSSFTPLLISQHECVPRAEIDSFARRWRRCAVVGGSRRVDVLGILLRA